MMKFYYSLLAVSLTLGLSACSDTELSEVEGEIDVGRIEPRLKPLGNRENFSKALRDALINQRFPGDYDVAASNAIEPPVDTAANSDSLSVPESAPVVPDSAADSAAPSDNADVTSTNVQEAGVDEQDRVKVSADGRYLYVLSSQNSGYYDLPFVSEPAVDVAFADAPMADSLPVAPYAPGTMLRVLELDDETPDATALQDLSIELENSTASGFFLYENGSQRHAVITASGTGYWGYWGSPLGFAGLESSVVRVDLSDPGQAAVSETLKIDGQFISTRRIGNQLFFASRYFPDLPEDQPWSGDSEERRQQIQTAELNDLIPAYHASDAVEPEPLIDPSTCFVAPQPDGDVYYSPDIITLGVINLDSMTLSDSECFLGATETLYASPTAVFLATTRYDYSEGPVTIDSVPVDTDDALEFDEAVVWYDPRSSTDIHQFDISDNGLEYAGSGTVSGHLGWNTLQKPFRMSEYNGVLRVATINDQQGPEHSPVLLTVLQSNGQGELQTLSQLPNVQEPAHIGEPGERLYASRFLGDRAYLVTFRQTDPLYVIDIADPQQPVIAGELKIEGYSDYLHPVDEGLLLGIGKDAVPAPDGGRGDGRGALVQGLKLALFDVSDPANPEEIQSLLIGQRGTQATALYDHRAVAVQAATDSHPMRVSFGIDVHGDARPLSRPQSQNAFEYYPWSYTGLHGFDITTGANAAIEPRGALITHRPDEQNGYWSCNCGEDRAVMVKDAVFYVHGRDVYAAHWDNLAVEAQAR